MELCCKVKICNKSLKNSAQPNKQRTFVTLSTYEWACPIQVYVHVSLFWPVYIFQCQLNKLKMSVCTHNHNVFRSLSGRSCNAGVSELLKFCVKLKAQ